MRFRDYFSIKHILFAVLIFAVLIPFAIRDSNNQVKVSFDDSNVYTSSNKYNLTIPFADIASVELTALAEPGEKVQDGFDNDILRCGVWTNETWGEYTICADRDTASCVLVTLKDGRVFVFSQKDDSTTEQLYETLLTRIS